MIDNARAQIYTLENVAEILEEQKKRLLTLAAELRGAAAPSWPPPPWIDRAAEMPINPNPTHPDMVKLKWKDWPRRELGDIRGITVHHTMSHSPTATARYCTDSKGYPSVQYHLWVSQGDGCPVYLLAPLEWALWHDHTGAHQVTVSVGMAGSLHKSKPPGEQLEAAARAVAYLMDTLGVPIGEVKGHTDRAPNKTVCPGWYVTGWAREFYEALRGAL